MLSLSYNVTVEISDVQYNMARGEAVIDVTFGGERDATVTAGSELSKVKPLLSYLYAGDVKAVSQMIEFHTRYNNAIAVESPRALRARIHKRGQGWLYEIGNSFNVDFELVEESVVIIRGPMNGIGDAKKAFMSHFGDVKRKVSTFKALEQNLVTTVSSFSTKRLDRTRFGTSSSARARDMSTELYALTLSGLEYPSIQIRGRYQRPECPISSFPLAHYRMTRIFSHQMERSGRFVKTRKNRARDCLFGDWSVHRISMLN